MLADPTWNYVVLALAAFFEGWSWRVTRRELDRQRRAGESRWKALQRNMDDWCSRSSSRTRRP